MTTTIDRYEILDTIGSGGMATVYRAYDPRFKREVAVKVMSADFANNRTFARRFEREAQTIAALEHTAIVPVHDYGEHQGQPFLVMRYMSGGSLANRIKRGPLSFEEADHILSRIAEALDWAHSESIIHRDIKPANILFDQHNHPCLADFGIVKLTESTSQLTGSGIVGTPAYMAPEMMDKGGLTHLIDVYALAITLFQMLTGRQPFEADTPLGLLMAHANKPVPDLRDFRSDLPDAIQTVIERGMAKDPMDRYQSAGALAAAFHEALQGSTQPVEQVMDELDAAPPSPEFITSTASPDAPTMDIGEDTAPPPAHMVAPPEPAPAPSARRRSSIPWAWIGGIGAVVVIGIIGLIAVLRGGIPPLAAEEFDQTEETVAEEEKPEPTVTPTTEPTRNPILVLAEAGVNSNADWKPYIQDFDGVQMALVPVGCFQIGSTDRQVDYAMVLYGLGADRSWFDDEQPEHEVCFEELFWIDVYEVTNQQYGSSGEWSGDDLPREEVNWSDALAHCESRGARLPTEAEWEYAARGPDGLIFPWGNDFNGSLGNFCDENCTIDWADEDVDDGYQNTAPVGSYPGGVSWVGAYDLSGNVWEWVNDWYDSDYYASLPASNPQGPESGEYRVLRGGSWGFSATNVRAADRKWNSPDSAGLYLGFRCARDYEP